MSSPPAYIVAARRTALGRVGGLHKARRVEVLSAPVIAAALSDCGINPREVEEVIVGNASAGGNPARLIALSSGMSENCPALTIDQQCASGLEAILSAVRTIACGDATIVVAGGAESISTAPWRIAKPKSIHQTPQFIRLEPGTTDTADEPQLFEASESLSHRLGLTRDQQDAWSLKSHMKAGAARDGRRLVGEIVALRSNADETRDQSANEPGLEDLEKLPPFLSTGGTLTPGNTSALHDGAAFVVVVSEAVWHRLGRPRALKLVASASHGVSPNREAAAPIDATLKLLKKAGTIDVSKIDIVELSESSAAQALAFSTELGIDPDLINPDGGAVVRGHPLGAAGAVLVVRLFSRLCRDGAAAAPARGLAALGTIDGLGIAALFESTA